MRRGTTEAPEACTSLSYLGTVAWLALLLLPETHKQGSAEHKQGRKRAWRPMSRCGMAPYSYFNK